MKFGVICFPGSCDEVDAVLACERVPGASAQLLWHGDRDLHGAEAVIVPGGFSYGDYLRAGAIARFAPVMEKVIEFAQEGGPVLGICNGFQILCEARLLPGALRRNAGLKFRCRPVSLRVETPDSPFTSRARRHDVLEIPINHFEGNYYAPPEVLAELEATDRVAFRYATAAGEVIPEANPNGAVGSIAGILSRGRNVLGMMPHPERRVDPAMGGTDGQVVLRSMLEAAVTLPVS